jgi:hypothetical protein
MGTEIIHRSPPTSYRQGIATRRFFVTPYTDEFEAYRVQERVLFLNPPERVRISAWLKDQERVLTVNPGRWQQLKDGSTNYISFKELGELMDCCSPCGYALDVIRGTVEVTTFQVCPNCNGSGQVRVFDSVHIVSCIECDGLGEIWQ